MTTTKTVEERVADLEAVVAAANSEPAPAGGIRKHVTKRNAVIATAVVAGTTAAVYGGMYATKKIKATKRAKQQARLESTEAIAE